MGAGDDDRHNHRRGECIVHWRETDTARPVIGSHYRISWPGSGVGKCGHSLLVNRSHVAILWSVAGRPGEAVTWWRVGYTDPWPLYLDARRETDCADPDL